MISVFFYCSSPYVGYTKQKADYVAREMQKCNAENMTKDCHRVFTSSGSYMLLGNFEGRKYFHTRQSRTEQYDEQGRRIYTDVAFLGESGNEETINRIALYTLFNEEGFYKEIAGMITLIDTGFTVDFDKLKAFLDKFNDNVLVETDNSKATKLAKDILSVNNKKLTFIITESTWSYFTKQVETDFGGSVLHVLSADEAHSIVENAKVSFSERGDEPVDPVVVPEEVVPEPSDDPVVDVIVSDDVKTDVGQQKRISALENELSELKKKYRKLERTAERMHLRGILEGIIGTGIVVLVIALIMWII